MTEPFVPPDWLSKTPSGDFRDYGDPLGRVWLDLEAHHRYQALTDIHADALRGDPRALESMRLYYVALTTKRLKS